jgi:HlyD family secretion protein
MLTGTLPPASVASRNSGRLETLFVQDNQKVNAGDFLAVIQNSASTKDVLALKKYLEIIDTTSYQLLSVLPSKRLEVGSMQTLYASFYKSLFNLIEYRRMMYYPKKIEMAMNRINLTKKQYKDLLRQEKLTKRQLFLSQKQYQRDSVLYRKGIVSAFDFENAQSKYLQELLAYENMVSSLNNIHMQLAQLKETVFDTRHEDTQKINELHSQISAQVTQLKAEIEAWEMNYILKAPISGSITFTDYWIENQNIPAGEVIFTIIPKHASGIIGKGSLPISRSGKVKIGQSVHIKLSNFPENEYGVLKGKIQNISLVPSAREGNGYYVVQVNLTNGLTTTYGKLLPFMANMQGTANIVTEDISLLERFFLPIKRVFKERIQ